MQLFRLCLLFPMFVAPALAADPDNGKRLAEAIPDARLELVDDARTFVPLDQPKRLAELIAAFIEETSEAPAAIGDR